MGFSLALMASRQVTLNVTLMESDHPVSGLAISQVDRLHVMTIGLGKVESQDFDLGEGAGPWAFSTEGRIFLLGFQDPLETHPNPAEIRGVGMLAMSWLAGPIERWRDAQQFLEEMERLDGYSVFPPPVVPEVAMVTATEDGLWGMAGDIHLYMGVGDPLSLVEDPSFPLTLTLEGADKAAMIVPAPLGTGDAWRQVPYGTGVVLNRELEVRTFPLEGGEEE